MMYINNLVNCQSTDFCCKSIKPSLTILGPASARQFLIGTHLKLIVIS